jgi:hypothetical protein
MPPNQQGAEEDTPEVQDAQVVDVPEIEGASLDTPTVEAAEELQ